MKLSLDLTVTISVRHVAGKFASKDEVEERLLEALVDAVVGGAYDADLSGLGADGESEYEVESAEVTE